jgi:hypothetical protein
MALEPPFRQVVRPSEVVNTLPGPFELHFNRLLRNCRGREAIAPRLHSLCGNLPEAFRISSPTAGRLADWSATKCKAHQKFKPFHGELFEMNADRKRSEILKEFHRRSPSLRTSLSSQPPAGRERAPRSRCRVPPCLIGAHPWQRFQPPIDTQRAQIRRLYLPSLSLRHSLAARTAGYYSFRPKEV